MIPDLSIEQKNYIEKNKDRLKFLKKRYSSLFGGKDYPIEMFLDYRFLYVYNSLWWKSNLDKDYETLAESFLFDLEDSFTYGTYETLMKMKLNQTWTTLDKDYNINVDTIVKESVNNTLNDISDFFAAIINNIGLIMLIGIGIFLIVALRK